MTVQTIDAAESNFPVNLFTLDETTAGANDPNWVGINCCGYSSYPYSIDSIWETDEIDADE